MTRQASAQDAPDSPSVLSEEERRAIVERERQINREAAVERMGGHVEERQAKTDRYLGELRRVTERLGRLQKRSHLADCSTSPEAFDEGRRLLAEIVTFAERELLEAGELGKRPAEDRRQTGLFDGARQ